MDSSHKGIVMQKEFRGHGVTMDYESQTPRGQHFLTAKFAGNVQLNIYGVRVSTQGTLN